MARSFCLYDLETGLRMSLSMVDKLMCEHFEVPCDPVKYLAGWFDGIGLLLACGRTFDEIKNLYGNTYRDLPPWEAGVAITEWLERHYRAECW